ncbi:MAG: hypothetical protein ACYS8L_01545, partial [Planctomycetota bacterium]
ESNTASGIRATVGGGFGNIASGDYYTTVGGGKFNHATTHAATVGGGKDNKASDEYATVGGGSDNSASGAWATVGGGQSDTASETYATVGGGYGNTASGWYATVGGGSENIASGLYATVGGGNKNAAHGDYSFAAGRRAKVLDTHHGTFIWADHTDAAFFSTGQDQFLIRAEGGVGIGTNSPSEELHVVGDIYCTGKLTSDGGNDPPYVLYNKETRKAIVKRVADEVPKDKLEGAVLFWNGDKMQFEVYLPAEGEFRDLQGDLLARTSELTIGR